MRRAQVVLRTWLAESIFVRPLVFIGSGFALALVMLGLDALAGPELLPGWMAVDREAGRLLFGTLAGATLTVAGLTFWVRAASVQLAASQYTPRVVQGALHDWFQQSMMGMLLGIFTYLVVVFMALQAPAADADVPQLATLLGPVLTGGSVLAVLAAIRNGVSSMQPGELSRRITDTTVARIRALHPRLGSLHQPGLVTGAPDRSGHVVRAPSSGWVQEIAEDEVLAALPPDAVVQLDVRIGLFVTRRRPLATIWTDRPLPVDLDLRLRGAVRLGRMRSSVNDIDYGIQQLVDVAIGSLSHHTTDEAGAYEAIAHLDIVMRELLTRELPPTAYRDEAGRQMIRRREFSIDDYVRDAFDRLRVAAAPYPVVVIALLEAIGGLIRELRSAGRDERIAPLKRQGRLALAACEAAGLLEDDLERVQREALRQGLADPSVSTAVSAPGAQVRA